MKKIVHESKIALITDEEWQNILDRLDVRKFKPSEYSLARINRTKCLLCATYCSSEYCSASDSVKCPLKIFQRHGTPGCMNLLLATTEGDRFVPSIQTTRIVYYEYQKAEAEEQLRKVYEMVLELPSE